MENLNILIGNNLSRIRKSKDFTLDQVAQLTHVSKSMLSQIEKGKKTPTITTLWKIANGLNISLSLLMYEKQKTEQFYSCDNKTPLIENDGKFQTFPFIPYNTNSNFEVLKIDILPHCTHKSKPHLTGVTEYVFGISGCVKIDIEDNSYYIRASESLVYPGDINHTYTNESDEVATVFTLILSPHTNT